MEKKDVIEFFDRCAPSWDEEMITNDEIIGKILDNAKVEGMINILDVACGTGVMIPYYLKRGVASVTGIDISPKMAKIAAEKFQEESKVEIICGDVEETVFNCKFDVIMIYNAFPHFTDGKRLVPCLCGLLKKGGRLSIAHGASRETINEHHRGAAKYVSNGLMEAEQLKEIFEPYFEVEVCVSDEKMYQVSGKKI